MAASIIDTALEHIDAQIADLIRAKEIIHLAAQTNGSSDDAPKVRKPRKKKGLPASDGI